MSEKERLPLEEASALAEQVKEILRPYCVRIEIAGSIRRGLRYCGDIEIVCVPKQIEGGLFSDPKPIAEANAVNSHLANRLDSGELELRLNKNGQRSFGALMMLLKYKGFALDVFACSLEQWGVTMVIRTGPADYSQAFVTQSVKHGSFLREGQSVKGWRVWAGGVALDTPEEADVFRVCGQQWADPESREWTK